jgi:hypothetical protein
MGLLKRPESGIKIHSECTLLTRLAKAGLAKYFLVNARLQESGFARIFNLRALVGWNVRRGDNLLRFNGMRFPQGAFGSRSYRTSA